MTAALAKLEQQLQDVDNLIARHPNRSGESEPSGRVRRPPGDQKPLLRSCVLLTYAAWEVYAEDSVIAAVETLASRAGQDQLPPALRQLVASQADAWSLAGEGWRSAVVDVVVQRVRGDETSSAAGSFGINTAGPGQLVSLHDEVFGERLLNRCRWRGMSASKVKGELASLVSVRGAIAHTGKTAGALTLGGVESWRAFVWRLGKTLDKRLDDFVDSQLRIDD